MKEQDAARAKQQESAQAPDFWLTLTKAMLGTLDLQQILYVILSGSTAGDGLNFNRAFLLLGEGRKQSAPTTFFGRLAIGPPDQEAAHRIWEAFAREPERFGLAELMDRYNDFVKDSEAAQLSRQFRRVQVGLEDETKTPFARLVRRALQQAPVLVNDSLIPVDGTSLRLCNVAMVPLVVEGRVLGALLVDNAYNLRRVQEQELEALSTVANLAAIAVERARLHERIRLLAVTDPVTGLASRHVFQSRGAALFRRAQEQDEPFSLLMADLDQFKEINDEYGHLCGDEVLEGLGEVIRRHLWGDAFGVRFGGDELLVLLPKLPESEAIAIAAQIRQQFAQRTFSEGLRVSVSIGVASRGPSHASLQELLADADASLYQAKQNTRS